MIIYKHLITTIVFYIPDSNKHPFNVIITDKYDYKLYPLDKYIVSLHGLWYYLPFADTKHSDELVFTNYHDPFFLPQYGMLKIWYGGDLKNYLEHNNVGRVCVNVYVHAL